MKTFFTILTLFASVALIAQERVPLKGKVTSNTPDLEGIYVINKNSEFTVTTAKGGYFTIDAQAKDTLIFSAIQFIAKQVVVEQENFSGDLLFVPLENLVHNLDELVVERSTITSESLGLIPKGQKRYTPAERKVFTATNGVDAVFNYFSGRTAMVKKAAEYEKKESLMEKINYIYTEEDIIAEFKIPKEYVKGFVFYIVEDKQFSAAIKSKNDGMAKFLMTALAEKYLALINEVPAKADDK